MASKRALACLNCKLECTADIDTPGCGVMRLKGVMTPEQRKRFSDEGIKRDLVRILRKMAKRESVNAV